MNATEAIALQLDAGLLAELDKRAKALGLTRSAFVGVVLIKHLSDFRNRKQVREALQQAARPMLKVIARPAPFRRPEPRPCKVNPRKELPR